MSRSRGMIDAMRALLISLAIALGWAAPAPAAAALPPWEGGINLYESGIFSTQGTFLWCTAANVQMMRNIVHDERDHSRTTQSRYFDWMRGQNRYSIPRADGVDPHGWAAGLRRWVDERYAVSSSTSFVTSLRAAVKSLRRTSRPVGLLVARGGHAWILHGFTATADPAVTDAFRITSVRVTGPLWGLQSRTYGYDMRPNTRLTPAELARFWTPWHYAGVRMVWEGRFVAIQARTG